MEDIAAKQIGDYQLIAIIGDGAQGRVYKASAVSDLPCGLKKGELVALKVVNIAGEDEQVRLKFQAQADILRRLSHESIVRYIDSFIWHSGELDECQCLVMEYLEGEDLTTRVKNMTGGLAWPQVEDIFEKCLAALIHARECGITHRDIKPSNIYLTKDGKVKLIDFDIARRDDSEQLSTAGWKGTFDYMAPDFITLEGFHGDEISDIFSLGVCFYQALTGQLPYERLGSNAHIGYVNRWHSGNSKPPSYRVGVFRVLAGARGFVSKSLSVKREERYQSFAEMLEDFRKIHYRVVRHKGKEDYELIALLGRGGFGEVFKARCASDGRLVAVKHLFSAQQSGRFIKEAKILQRYNHANLVQYVDFLSQETNTGEKQFFLVMEYLEGMPGWTLRTRIKNEGRIAAEECVTLFNAYLDALNFMHSNARPIIHRDIKPGNLYAPVGRPEKGKIFDLGVARDVSGTVTVGGVPGTLDYMAPEFADASGDRGSPRSDVYALGLCLYEALTGKPVYERLPKDINSAWTGFLTRVKMPPAIDFDDPVFKEYPRFVQIIRRSIAINPAERFAGAKEMSAALTVAMQPVSTSEQSDELFDDVEVTMATTPGGDGVTLGTRPLQGDINDYLEQIGAAKKSKTPRAKKELIVKVGILIFLIAIAGVAAWLGIAVLMGKGRKTVVVDTVASAELAAPEVATAAHSAAPIESVAASRPEAQPVVSAPETEQSAPSAAAPLPVKETETEVAEQPAASVETRPQPQLAVKIAAADFKSARDILAIMPTHLNDQAALANAERAMQLLEENEGLKWRGVDPVEQQNFIQAQRGKLADIFSDRAKKLTLDILNLSAAGKSSDAEYKQLNELKTAAPLLAELCAGVYQQCNADAEKSIKSRRVAEMLATMITRCGNAAKLPELIQIIKDFKKLEAAPQAELPPTQVAAFQTVARTRSLTLARESVAAYRAATETGRMEEAEALRREFDAARLVMVGKEYGQPDLEKLSGEFDAALKAAEKRALTVTQKQAQPTAKVEPDVKVVDKPAVVVDAAADKAAAPQPQAVMKPALADQPQNTPTDAVVAPPTVVAPVSQQQVADTAKSYLEITVSPAKATIQINGADVGSGKVEVEPGTNHRVDITCAGYQPVRQFYRVEKGKTRKVDILLQKGKSRSLFGF